MRLYLIVNKRIARIRRFMQMTLYWLAGEFGATATFAALGTTATEAAQSATAMDAAFWRREKR